MDANRGCLVFLGGVLCNYIRFSTHLCIFWLWLYFLSARVRLLGSVSALPVVRWSILRAVYLVHLWAFCSKGSTGRHIPAAECENRTGTDTHTHTHTRTCCLGASLSLIRVRSHWLVVKEANLCRQVCWLITVGKLLSG